MALDLNNSETNNQTQNNYQQSANNQNNNGGIFDIEAPIHVSNVKKIVNKCKPQMGIGHNLVIIDPIYKAYTFGSYSLNDEYFNAEQQKNKLVLVRNKFTKYSYNFIKN